MFNTKGDYGFIDIEGENFEGVKGGDLKGDLESYNEIRHLREKGATEGYYKEEEKPIQLVTPTLTTIQTNVIESTPIHHDLGSSDNTGSTIYWVLGFVIIILIIGIAIYFLTKKTKKEQKEDNTKE